MRKPTNTKRRRPIIRVFFSSTFSDLKLERDALARRVFPKLEQLCQTEGFQFQAIDLRWGVSTEAGLDHRTMRICFEALRRSQEVSPQPNFLILLGDRYGWRPLPEEISKREFAALLAATQFDSHGNTIDGIGDKTAEDVLNAWYRLDTNAVPPVHVLRPRTNSPDGQDYTQVKDAEGNLVQDANGNNQDTPAWSAVQKVLWEVIGRPFPSTGLASRFDSLSTDDPSQPSKPVPSIVRFQASATEQEIWAGALTVPDAEQHVLAFFREITRCDIPKGRIANPSNVKDYFDLDGDTIDTIDATAHDAQTALKQTINDRLGNKAARFEASLTVAKDASGQPTMTVSVNHLDDLCQQAESGLTAIIDRQIKEYWDPKASEKQKSALSQTELAARDLEIERDEHLRLADEHTAHFVGREEEGGPLKRIQAYLGDASRLPLLIYGDSGCGKTALLARAFKRPAPDSNPIIRFIGVTPQSSNIRSLLGNLCLELRQLETGSDPFEGRTPGESLTPFQTQPLPTDIHELQQEFRQHLRSASEQQRPVVLFLDALDQLSVADGGLHLSWLPGRSLDPLPAGVKIIVSCLSDRHDDDPAARPFAMLRDVLPENQVVELDALPLDDARHLLDRWLSGAGRTIGDENPNQEKQRSLINERLASDKQCRQPLFLKLLSEEVKLWRSYDENFHLYEPEQRDQDATKGNAQNPHRSNAHVDALLRQLFDRLSDSTNHGKLLVERALGYLAAARRGLSETEIPEVLFADPDYKMYLVAESERSKHTLPAEPQRIPVAIWSRLHFDLASYLTERTAAGGNVLTLYHRQVAEWVKAQFVDKTEWNPHELLAEFFRSRSDPHALTELPYQFAMSRQQEQLKVLLANASYLDERCVARDIHGLIADYELLAMSNDALNRCQSFLRLHVQRISEFPNAAYALMYREGPEELKQAIVGLQPRRARKRRLPWLRTTAIWNPATIPSENPVLRVAPITHQLYDLTAAMAFAADRELVFFLRSRGEIGLIDVARSNETSSSVSCRTDDVLALACSRSGDELSVAYGDGKVEILRLTYNEHGQVVDQNRVAELPYLVPQVEPPAFAFTPHEFVYQSVAGTIDAFDLADRRERTLLAEELGTGTCELSAIATSNNQVYVVVYGDDQSRILTLKQADGRCHILSYPAPVVALSCSPDGLVAVAFSDGCLQLFNTTDGFQLFKSTVLVELPRCLAIDELTVTWATIEGTAFRWSFTDAEQNTCEIDRAGVNFCGVQQLEIQDDGSMLAITNSATVRFRLVPSDQGPARCIEYIMPATIAGGYYAIERQSNSLILINGVSNEVRHLIAESDDSFAFANNDPDCILGIRASGKGMLFKPSENSGSNEAVEKIPARISSVVSHQDGFAMTTDQGRLAFVDRKGAYREVCTIDSDDVRSLRLCSMSVELVWLGSSLLRSGSGRERLFSMIFLKTDEQIRDIHRGVGSRVFQHDAGLPTAVAFDHSRKTLYSVWQNGYPHKHCIRAGSRQDYVESRESVHPLPDIDIDVTGITATPDGSGLYMLSKSGNLFYVCSDDWKVTAVLSCGSPITHIGSRCNPDGKIILVFERSKVELCRLM